MKSSSGMFWDHRYREEGAVWGDSPSSTALIASEYLHRQDRVLEVGFGYGRDLLFLVRQGCRVYGIDPSLEGSHQAEERLRREHLQAERLITGQFEDSDFPEGWFDMIVSHRMVHLLTTQAALDRFVAQVQHSLRRGGILCLGARNCQDLESGNMTLVEPGVYEYKHRPGHQIRYWDDEAFEATFGNHFNITRLERTTESESLVNPVTCHLTVMVGINNFPTNLVH